MEGRLGKNVGGTEIGLILPHFSDKATWDRLIGQASRIEDLGFDSVWVRDTLNFHGHGYELPGRRFVDPFVTLASIASRTTKLLLGTAVLVPYRHPLITAQLVGSLSWVSQGRFQLGIGPGAPRDPFLLTGVPYEDRITLCRETVEILRASSKGGFSYHGQLTFLEDVLIDPAPPADMRIWYGGGSKASIRRATQYGDGLLPGRCPFNQLDEVRRRLGEKATATRQKIRLGTIPLVIVEEDRKTAEARLDGRLSPLLDYLSRQWGREYSTVEQTAGAVVYGSPEMVAEQLQEFFDRKLDLVVLDLRLQMDRFEESIALIAARVFPLLKAASRLPDARPTALTTQQQWGDA